MKPTQGSAPSPGEAPIPLNTGGYSLIEVMIAMSIFVMAWAGIFLEYGQGVRMLDGFRQVSRAEDVCMANIEFLRTRNWTQLTNLVTATSASSNLIEQIPYNSSNIVSTLTIVANDPKKIGLRNVSRVILMQTFPTANTPSEPMRLITVLVTWETMQGRILTNSMSVGITKGGMTADVL